MSGKSQFLVLCLVTGALVAPTTAQQNVRPTRMQSPERQEQDAAQCSTWAVQQTGYDPAQPWFAPPVSPPTPVAGASVQVRSRERVTTRQGAGDAAVAGAIVTASAQPEASAAAAAIVGRDAGDVIAGGAVAGATVQRDAVSRPALQQERVNSPRERAADALFQKARIECLEARGYAMR